MNSAYHKLAIISLILVYNLEVSGQRYTFFKLGRPPSFEENVATRFVAKNEFNLAINYSDIDLRDSGAGDSIMALNARTSLALIEKFGQNWQEDLNNRIQEQLRTFRPISEEIKLTQPFAELQLVESMIQYERSRCNKRKIRAKVFGQASQSQDRSFYTWLEYVFNTKSQKLKLASSQQVPIDFEYLENGINKKP